MELAAREATGVVDEKVIVDDAAGNQNRREDQLFRLEIAVRRAGWMFPGLNIDGSKSEDARDVKISLKKLIQRRVESMDSSTVDRLMKRENLVEFCTCLGMSPELAGWKFRATVAFEAEMGHAGKTPSLISIMHLVDTIDLNNPFTSIDSTGIDDNYNKFDPWLLYLGVKLKPEHVKATLDKVEEILKAGDLNTCFMHGTTGSVLGDIYKKNGRVKCRPSPNRRSTISAQECKSSTNTAGNSFVSTTSLVMIS